MSKLRTNLGRMARVLFAWACIGVILIVTADVSPASAAARTGPGSSVAAAGPLDSIRCNTGWYGTTSSWRQLSFCFFAMSTFSGENVNVAPLFRAHPTTTGYYGRGTTPAATVSTFRGNTGFMNADNDTTISAFADPCADGIWIIGPTTWNGLTVPSGGAVFDGATATSVCTNAALNSATATYQQTTTSCASSGGVNLTYGANTGCRGNMIGTGLSRAGLTARNWDGLDYFPGGSPYVLYDDWCDSLIVSSTLPPNKPISNPTVWTLVLDQADDSVMPAGYSVGVRYFPSQTFTDITSVVDAWVAPAPWGITSMYTGPTIQHDVEVHCRTVGGVDYYYDDNGVQSSTPHLDRACAAVSVKWPSFPRQGGDVIPLTIQIAAGSLSGTTVTSFKLADFKNGLPPTEYALTLKDYTTGVTDTGPYERGQNLYTEFVFTDPERTISANDLRLYCRDASGLRQIFAGVGGVLGGTAGAEGDSYTQRLTQCMDGVTDDLELTSPASWVSAMLDGSICIAQFLFQPTDGDISDLRTAATAATTKAPFSYMAESMSFVTTAVSGASASVVAASSDCLRVFPGFTDAEFGTIIPVQCKDLHPVSNGIGSARTIQTVLLGIGFAWSMLTQTRSILAA